MRAAASSAPPPEAAGQAPLPRQVHRLRTQRQPRRRASRWALQLRHCCSTVRSRPLQTGRRPQSPVQQSLPRRLLPPRRLSGEFLRGTLLAQRPWAGPRGCLPPAPMGAARRSQQGQCPQRHHRQGAARLSGARCGVQAMNTHWLEALVPHRVMTTELTLRFNAPHDPPQAQRALVCRLVPPCASRAAATTAAAARGVSDITSASGDRGAGGSSAECP